LPLNGHQFVQGSQVRMNDFCECTKLSFEAEESCRLRGGKRVLRDGSGDSGASDRVGLVSTISAPVANVRRVAEMRPSLGPVLSARRR
jgi:hypothetical protein